MLHRRRFAADGRGRFRVQLRTAERQLLQRLPNEALAMVDGNDPAARRLFPVAYPQNEAAEAEYRLSVGAELVKARRACLQMLAETALQPVIDEEQLGQWTAALETLRLMLGTQLDVTEDMALPAPGDPRAAPVALYHFLSSLQDEAVQALVALLPPGTDDDPVDTGPSLLDGWDGIIPDHPPAPGDRPGGAGPDAGPDGRR